MIEINAKIHDNFSVEFKVGFVVKHKTRENHFAINTWIFLPNSLDINPQTYGKDQFYRDVKSNVRLITPAFILRNIAGGEAVPLNNLRKAMQKVSDSFTRHNIAEYEYQIKMFSAIFKSALRDETLHIKRTKQIDEIGYLCDDYINNIHTILSEYRLLYRLINVPSVSEQARNYFLFGDEFMSNMIEIHTYRIIEKIDNLPNNSLARQRETLAELIKQESDYKTVAGYPVAHINAPENNRNLIVRHNLLKKYIESDLYIKLNKKRDGVAVEQLYYSIAAGTAMIFATVVAFSFQRKFGSLSIPLFFALVVSYMLKDRIKDLMRYYFAHKLGNKYFDNKAIINIKDQPVGWIKEGVDFINDDRTPAEVLNMRNRTTLLQAENRIYDEKIILYRKRVYIDSQLLEQNNEYPTAGINDILRLHVHRFTQKMDNPQVPIQVLDENGDIRTISAERIYYINIIMQFQYEKQLEYKRFRVALSRAGIEEVQEMK